jgi:two-component system LytT family response regulator
MPAPLPVVIADDEPAAVALMARHAAADGRLRVAGSVGDGKAAVDAVRRLSPRLLLLDVEMPGLDGFGVLAELQRMGKPLPRVIFVTAFDRYAVRAFDVHAVDYLLKPVTAERFREAIDRCVLPSPPPSVTGDDLAADALRASPRRLLVRERGRIVPVPLSAVDWIEAEGDYVRIHTGGRSHLVERTLAEMESLLASSGFMRIHRGAIVNVERVAQLQPEGSGRYRLVLRDGSELAVSRSYSGRFREALI